MIGTFLLFPRRQTKARNPLFSIDSGVNKDLSLLRFIGSLVRQGTLSHCVSCAGGFKRTSPKRNTGAAIADHPLGILDLCLSSVLSKAIDLEQARRLQSQSEVLK